MIQDLWPKEIKTETQGLAPLTILKQQAAFLGKKTSNIVQAEVVKSPPEAAFLEEWAVNYRFELKAPAWGGYRYTLFRFFTNVPLYPVAIEVDMDIAREIRERPEQTVIKIFSQKELEEILARVFAAEKTRDIIEALMIQSGAEIGSSSSKGKRPQFQGRKLGIKKKSFEDTSEVIQD